MAVGQVSNGSEANRVKPGDISEKKKVEHQRRKSNAEAAGAKDSVSGKMDRVEISHVAKSLLRKLVAENDFDKQKYPELATLEDKFLQRMWQELGDDLEIREKRVAEVRARLKESFYDRPDVLMATVSQIVNELLGE